MKITLNDNDVDFIEYHIKSYIKDSRKGKIQDAYHAATSILLFLYWILHPESNWEPPK